MCAQSSTAQNACNVQVQLADENGILQDISGSSNEASLEFDNKLGATKVFGTEYPIRLQCGKDAAISLKSVWSTALNEARDILDEIQFGTGGKRMMRITVPNSNVGSIMYYGYVQLEKYVIPVKADQAEPIIVSADFKPTGNWNMVTRAS